MITSYSKYARAEEFSTSEQPISQKPVKGATASIKSSLLYKKEPKMAYTFDSTTERQYDYEAVQRTGGDDVVIISPSNSTKLLQGQEAKNFWAALDHIENVEEHGEYLQQVQSLISSYFDRGMKAAATCIIKVNAVALKKSSESFLSKVDFKEGAVDKMRFTTKREKAVQLTRRVASRIVQQLSNFRLTGNMVNINS